MQAEQSPDGAEQDSDGNWWVDLTRRQTLAGLGAAGSAVLAGLGAAQDGETVGGDRSVVGEDYQVRSVELDQTGTMKALYVAVRPEHLPATPPQPAVGFCLEGRGGGANPVISTTGAAPAETDTIQTNMAEIHVVDDPSTVTVDKGPALVASKQSPGLQLVVDGSRHSRTSLGGSAARVHGGQSFGDLPSTLGSSETPALGVVRDANANPNPGVWL